MMSMTNTLNTRRDIKRGDIFWVQIPVLENSQIQSGIRPILIIARHLILKLYKVSLDQMLIQSMKL